jgi:hypothetical protein
MMLIYLGRKLLDPKLEQTWCIAPKNDYVARIHQSKV